MFFNLTLIFITFVTFNVYFIYWLKIIVIIIIIIIIIIRVDQHWQETTRVPNSDVWFITFTYDLRIAYYGKYDGGLRDDFNYLHSLSYRILAKRVNAKKHVYWHWQSKLYLKRGEITDTD